MSHRFVQAEFLADQHQWPADNRAHVRRFVQRVAHARKVIRYKSAKYTVEHPLLIGASAAGVGQADLQCLSRFGLDLGEAFQLRDDILGVVGDPSETGKPAVTRVQIIPDHRPLTLAGKNSVMMEYPTTFSAPRPSPITKRSAMRDSMFGANAEASDARPNRVRLT